MMLKKISQFFKRYQILITVFLTGACALVIEIVGMRLLTPYFGNTMFTTSSVISVFLAALSFGYYFGGALADKKPSFTVFYMIILFSGISVMIIQIIKYGILPNIWSFFSIITGPIVTSIILFLIPGFLLGMLSPFAIKLQQKKFPKMGVGKISGEIFFWSTFGSIFGSIITGFILIPNFEINSIVIGTAGLLFILSFLHLMPFIFKKKIILFSVIAALGITLIAVLMTLRLSRKYVYKKEGLYQLITIIDGVNEENKPTRNLFLDLNNSGARFMNSKDLAFNYTKYYEIYKFINPNIKNALFIGGGTYTLPEKVIETNKNITADVIEIEPGLYDLAKEYFDIKENPRMVNHVTDGRRFLTDTQKKYDYIFGDAYLSHHSVPAHLTTVEFFNMAKEKMNKDGIFIVNIIGSLDPKAPPFLYSEIKTFRTVFPNSFFVATRGPENKDVQNIIFVGINGNKQIDWNDKLITGSISKNIREIPQNLITVSDSYLAKYSIFTDDFAPVDYYMHVTFAN